MAERRLACALVAAALSACSQSPSNPPPCAPVPSFDPGVPAPGPDCTTATVWGFADLHAHPAVEVAFNGDFIWGTALDDAPVNASELPAIEACPVETHLRNAASPVDRFVGGIVFPQVSRIASFAHAPVGSLPGGPVTDAWPNARDVIHQQMNVSSIRRAYEAGLRLMFASATDDQMLSALLQGPNFINGFVPSPSADYDSARLQLDLIERMADQNSNWMEIARSPGEARCIIASGKLALVLSLEMEGLQEADVDRLVQDYGVRHIVPIHLVDNNVGGTAVNFSLFNTASAMVNRIYTDAGAMQFMSVAPSQDFPAPFGVPEVLGTAAIPVYVGLSDVDYDWYRSLCYEPLDACSGATAPPVTSFVGYGQKNKKGLCATDADCVAGQLGGAAILQRYVDAGLIIDVSHMSAQSVTDTLQAVPTAIPVIASHGDITHLCPGPPGQPPCDVCSQPNPVTERNLDGDAAREIIQRRGVLGLGSGTGTYSTQTVFEARGVPLWTLDAGQGATSACAVTGSAPGCEAAVPVDLADAGTPIDALQIDTLGGITSTTGNAQPFVRVELRDAVPAQQYQRRVLLQPLTCTSQNCTATVQLPTRETSVPPTGSACTSQTCDGGNCGASAYTVDDLELVRIEWLYLACDAACQQDAGSSDVAGRQCESTWSGAAAPVWSVQEVVLFAHTQGGPPQASSTLSTLGPRTAPPLATLDGTTGQFTVYERSDRPSAVGCAPISGRLLRVTLTSNQTYGDLRGSNPAQVGANACVAVRLEQDGGCAGPAPAVPGAHECPAGWVGVNQRGEWGSGVSLYTFVRTPPDAGAVCGVDFTLLDGPASSSLFAVDEVRVEAAEDPVGRWVRRYAEVARNVADGGMGVIAFGTDFNGFNGMMDLSEAAVPAGAVSPSACPAVGDTTAPGPDAGPVALAPLRIRNADGSLGQEVRIDERGLATYGLLADMMALIGEYPGCGADVHDSLMLSAEGTLRAWEARDDPSAPQPPALPTRAFLCDGGAIP